MSETVVMEFSREQLLLVARAVAAAERHHEEPWRTLYGEVRDLLEAELEGARVAAAGCCCCSGEGA